MRHLAGSVVIMIALPVTAQQQQLQRADSLLIAGQYEQARTALADWQRAHPPTERVEPATRARALYLTARLTTDANAAREQYLTLVSSYPTASETPDALLRLGQGLLAAGEAARAINYLERLVNDYRLASNRAEAYLWLARAQLAGGLASDACSTSKSGLGASAGNAELSEALQEEHREACAESQQLRAVVSRPPAALPEATARSATSGNYALQIGAFRELRSAENIVARLRQLGFEARITYLPGNTLARVRVGRFESSAAAADERRRLQNANIDAIVVDDVARERAQR